jgi:large subunit ribosomal protein L13Ae
VVPDAFRVTRLKVGRRYCVLGRISAECGWKMQAVVERLEAKRKAEGTVYWDTKKAELAKVAAAKEAVAGDAVLAKFGY